MAVSRHSQNCSSCKWIGVATLTTISAYMFHLRRQTRTNDRTQIIFLSCFGIGGCCWVCFVNLIVPHKGCLLFNNGCRCGWVGDFSSDFSITFRHRSLLLSYCRWLLFPAYVLFRQRYSYCYIM